MCVCALVLLFGFAVVADSPKVKRGRDVRIFVALFSYDPATMSPNPDAAEEELPFVEGQIVKVSVTACLKYSRLRVYLLCLMYFTTLSALGLRR